MKVTLETRATSTITGEFDYSELTRLIADSLAQSGHTLPGGSRFRIWVEAGYGAEGVVDSDSPLRFTVEFDLVSGPFALSPVRSAPGAEPESSTAPPG